MAFNDGSNDGAGGKKGKSSPKGWYVIGGIILVIVAFSYLS